MKHQLCATFPAILVCVVFNCLNVQASDRIEDVLVTSFHEPRGNGWSAGELKIELKQTGDSKDFFKLEFNGELGRRDGFKSMIISTPKWRLDISDSIKGLGYVYPTRTSVAAMADDTYGINIPFSNYSFRENLNKKECNIINIDVDGGKIISIIRIKGVAYDVCTP